MSGPIDGAIESLLRGALCDVRAEDVHVSGLEVFTGEGVTFAVCPSIEVRDAVADMLVRAIKAADEADETSLGAVLALDEAEK